MGIDLTGQRFGRLIVASRNPISASSGHIRWNCICDCGNKVTVNGTNLVSGNTNSCGCLRIEIHTVHGMSHYPEYKIWEGMIQRCTNLNFHQYDDYGGRGITVCDRWLSSFASFIVDVGRRPGPEYTLDREDNNKGYDFGNCRWATRKEQVCNRRNNVFYEYKGRKYLLHQLAELPEVKANNISFYVLRGRIRNSGWPVEKAISEPVQDKSPPTYTYNGITKTIKEWSIEYNVGYDNLYSRLNQLKWDFERATETPYSSPK